MVAGPSWSRSETAQVTPYGTAPSTDTHPDNVSCRPGVFAGGILDYSPFFSGGKRAWLHKHILYHLAAGLKSIPQPILVSIQAQKRSWTTCRMSAAKQKPEGRPKAPERHFPQPSVQKHLCRKLPSMVGWSPALG